MLAIGFERVVASLVVVLGLGACAKASVTAFTPASSGSALHTSGLYSTSLTAPLFAWDAPYTTTSLLDGFWETRGRLTTTLPISTPTHVRMEGNYFGFAGITTTSMAIGNFAASVVEVSGELTFTVDSPSVVTISSFNTISSANGFGEINAFGFTLGRLRFQGTDYTTNAVDASFAFNVGPGTYTAQFVAKTDAVVFATANAQWFSEQSQKFRIDVVSPVPAPGALVVLGLGLASVTARRRRVRVTQRCP